MTNKMICGIRNEIESIPFDPIRRFTRQFFENRPWYFDELMASTSGNNHRGETLAEHTFCVIHEVKQDFGRGILRTLPEKVCPQEDSLSILVSGAACHDLYRCGIAGFQPIENLRTVQEHGMIAADIMWKVSQQFSIPFRYRLALWEGIRGHNGSWDPWYRGVKGKFSTQLGRRVLYVLQGADKRTVREGYVDGFIENLAA